MRRGQRAITVLMLALCAAIGVAIAGVPHRSHEPVIRLSQNADAGAVGAESSTTAPAQGPTTSGPPTTAPGPTTPPPPGATTTTARPPRGAPAPPPAKPRKGGPAPTTPTSAPVATTVPNSPPTSAGPTAPN
jgi:hypothetical protein